MSGDSFQVRFHPKLGVVIYDAVAQLGLAKEQIRLFKLSTMSAHTFMRAIVSKDLSEIDTSVTDANTVVVTDGDAKVAAGGADVAAKVGEVQADGVVATPVRSTAARKKSARAKAAAASNTPAAAVHLYRTAKIERRKPYCEHCRRHFGSVDFTVCADCSAIRCTCGTCACASSTRRRRAA